MIEEYELVFLFVVVKCANLTIEFSFVHFVQKLIVRLRIRENFTIIHQVAIDNIDYVKHQVILVDKLYLTYDPEMESLIPVPIHVSCDTEILIFSLNDIQRNSTIKIDQFRQHNNRFHKLFQIAGEFRKLRHYYLFCRYYWQ